MPPAPYCFLIQTFTAINSLPQHSLSHINFGRIFGSGGGGGSDGGRGLLFCFHLLFVCLFV
jgi:hypothetical protein